MNRQLYRSKNNRMIAGVCGGISEYFNIDPTIVRILWALFALYGVGVIAYIIALIVIPEGSYENTGDFNEQRPSVNIDSKSVSLIIGGALIVLGTLVLGKRFIPGIDKLFWPMILIAVGALVIIRGGRKN
jgi:phage shock protein PspC (stress-responsive transcriptional regulator)